MARKPKPSGRGTRARSLEDYKRRSDFRPPLPRILIVCEGEKTELNYFHAITTEFRLTSVKMRTEQGGIPRKFVESAVKQRQEDGDLDEVWCVLDVENPTRMPLIKDAVSLAEKKDIELAISNPAFEFWLLLHFTMTDKPFQDAQEVIDELKSRYLDDYQKDYLACAKLLCHLDEAIGNAKQVLQNHADGSYAPNPSTYVHYLADRLKSLQRSEA